MNKQNQDNNMEYGTLDMPSYSQRDLDKYKPRVKRALYVSTKFVSKIFSPSDFDSSVWVTDKIDDLLKVISHYGKIGPRRPEGRYGGLENDITKQQIILYTIVLDSSLKHILFYTRADAGSVNKKERGALGDKRLRGKGSVGFGGHIEHIDQLQWRVLSLLIPGFYEQIRRTLSLEVARIREFEEELGISGSDLSHFFLAKAFRQVYPPEQLKSFKTIPVGAVHTCICAVAVLDSHKLTVEKRPLIFQKSEIATLSWIKVGELAQFIADFTEDGGEVEEWSEIVLHFLPDILKEAKKITKIKSEHNS